MKSVICSLNIKQIMFMESIEPFQDLIDYFLLASEQEVLDVRLRLYAQLSLDFLEYQSYSLHLTRYLLFLRYFLLLGLLIVLLLILLVLLFVLLLFLVLLLLSLVLLAPGHKAILQVFYEGMVQQDFTDHIDILTIKAYAYVVILLEILRILDFDERMLMVFVISLTLLAKVKVFAGVALKPYSLKITDSASVTCNAEVDYFFGVRIYYGLFQGFSSQKILGDNPRDLGKHLENLLLHHSIDLLVFLLVPLLSLLGSALVPSPPVPVLLIAFARPFLGRIFADLNVLSDVALVLDLNFFSGRGVFQSGDGLSEASLLGILDNLSGNRPLQIQNPFNYFRVLLYFLLDFKRNDLGSLQGLIGIRHLGIDVLDSRHIYNLQSCVLGDNEFFYFELLDRDEVIVRTDDDHLLVLILVDEVEGSEFGVLVVDEGLQVLVGGEAVEAGQMVLAFV